MKKVLLLAACMAILASVATPAASAQSVGCDGFGSQFGAQQFYDFNATPEQQAQLDANGDGLACTNDDRVTPETAPQAFEGQDGVCEGRGEGDPDCAAALLESVQGTEAAPEAQYGTASESYTTLPDTGGPSLLLPASALLMGTGIVGYAVIRRR